MPEAEEHQLDALADVLRSLANLRRDIDGLEYTVVGLVRAYGATWEQIGDHLGISRQAAQKRYEKARSRRR